MNPTTGATDHKDNQTVTVGIFRSRCKGDILLIYINNGEADPSIQRYDRLSRQNRLLVRAAAQDPLCLLKRTKARN